MIRPGSIEDAPRAAPMRQRAWPDMIVTEEGIHRAPYEESLPTVVHA